MQDSKAPGYAVFELWPNQAGPDPFPYLLESTWSLRKHLWSFHYGPGDGWDAFFYRNPPGPAKKNQGSKGAFPKSWRPKWRG